MKFKDSLVLKQALPGEAQDFIPVNAKYHAEERCERLGIEYDENYERLVREMANDILSGSW